MTSAELAPAPDRPAAAVRPRGRAQRRRRAALAASFVMMVLLPVATAAAYLYLRAADQYASFAGFTVRQAETAAPVDMLGGLTQLGGGGASDADVLSAFLRSSQIVELVGARLDLRAIFGRARADPVFALRPGGSAEDLAEYWQRMVAIHHDANTGLIDLRVLAFRPEDAQAIAAEIVAQASLRINALSDAARAEATRDALRGLEDALARLKAARQALGAFRADNQLIDPAADLQGQMGLLNSLQTQLADALIELDLLDKVTREGDSRLEQARRKIAVIEARIAEERRKLGAPQAGMDGTTGRSFTGIVGRYEELKVDVEFAEQSYVAARAAHDAALAEARRQSRFLAAHIAPTLAESPRFPRRITLVGLTALFAGIVWALTVLVAYSVRDRR